MRVSSELRPSFKNTHLPNERTKIFEICSTFRQSVTRKVRKVSWKSPGILMFASFVKLCSGSCKTCKNNICQCPKSHLKLSIWPLRCYKCLKTIFKAHTIFLTILLYSKCNFLATWPRIIGFYQTKDSNTSDYTTKFVPYIHKFQKKSNFHDEYFFVTIFC